MDELIQHDAEPLPPARNHRLRRGVHLLPGFLTTLNLSLGCYALHAVFQSALGAFENFDRAASAIGFAILFDALDGRIARATNSTSEFGKQYDSLADVVSFGVAPAFLAYAWGVRRLALSPELAAAHVLNLGKLICFAFIVCCAWRLARFNIQGMAPGSSSRYFVGLPCPAAAGMIAATVHCLKFPNESWPFALVWLGLVGGLALLMSSTVRYYSFKDIGWTRRQPSLVVVAIALLVWAVVYYSEEVLLIVAGTYALSGLTLGLVRGVRHRLASRPA
jgi:CDP-diacylglycerol--serine O-phosphatidyltransferase